MKIAFVTSRSVSNQWGESHASVSHNLIDYLTWCGYSSIILHKENLNILGDLSSRVSPDLVVLSGGESLGVDSTRDEFELSVLRLCEMKTIPVLGICRGMQMLGLFFDQPPIKIEGHSGVRHMVTGVHNSEVNSYHNFGYLEVSSPLVTLVQGQDDTVEAFRHLSLPWLGIMWHPERESVENWIDVLRFQR
jgi:gamma-glutamyl-gamma-aminobutyrate hydrolase PuuD